MALTQIEPYSFDSSNSFSVANLAVSGNVTVTGNIVGNVIGAQPGITSLSTLTSLTVTGPATLQLASDILNVITGATGTVTHDLSSSGVFFHTTPAANFTANFTNVPVTNNRVITATTIISQGTTAYLPTSVQIESVPQSIRWVSGNAPIGGNASKFDVVSFTLIRTSNSWIVMASSSFFN